MALPRHQPDDPNAKIVAFKEIQAKAKRAAHPKPDPDSEKRRIRSNVAALVFAGLLIVLGWFLVQKLGQTTRMEDCLMSGRTNCAPIATGPAEN